MSEQHQKAQGGHLVKIMINEQLVGFGRSSNIGQDFGVEGVYVLGDVGPQEHVPMRWDGTVSLDSFVIHAGSLDAQTVQLLELIAQGREELKTQTTFNLTYLGRNDEEMFTLLECTPANLNLNVQSNQFTGQNATFKPKDIRRGPTYQFKGDVTQGLGAELG